MVELLVSDPFRGAGLPDGAAASALWAWLAARTPQPPNVTPTDAAMIRALRPVADFCADADRLVDFV